MELTRVHIRNFRSIEDCTITFDHKCRVLVGINEAGKTNILRALSFLSENVKVDPKDKREYKDDEPIEQEAFVNFFFKLNQTEKEAVSKKASSKILATFIDTPVAITNEQLLDLSTLVSNHVEILYKVNINTKKRLFTAILTQEDIEIFSTLKKPSPTLSNDIFNSHYKSITSPNEFFAIDTSDYSKIPENYFSPLEKSDIIKIINFGITDVISNKIPDCLMWDYDEKNLLPSQISLSQFVQNPDVCIPLKNMFLLAGIQDIPKTVSEYQQRTFGLRNLLERVSKLSSEHLHKVWREYKDLQIILTLNGDAIETAIRDKYKLYDLSRRSDGFKRFISFILLISMRAKSKELSNTLLLYDEPEISLHPSGCRHLRDELIRISENNYVVFSTHSIFMIDQNITNRHYIVIKENETTTVKEVNESNITDEEVLYNALNYSIFENLKKNNLIFEGWRDKHLFKIAITSLPQKLVKHKKILDGLGFCHAQGVKNAAQLAADLELGKRNYLIISDSDKAAIEKQSVFKGEGQWLRYDQMISNEVIVTGEDFIKPDAFLVATKNSLLDRIDLPELTEADLINPKGKILALTSWLEKSNISKPEIKSIVEKIKDSVFSNLTHEHIEEKYFLLIEKVSNHFINL